VCALGASAAAAALVFRVPEVPAPPALVADGEQRYGSAACATSAHRLGNTVSGCRSCGGAYFEAFTAPTSPALARALALCDGRDLGLAFFRSPPQSFYHVPPRALLAGDGAQGGRLLLLNGSECMWCFPLGVMIMGKDASGERLVYGCSFPPLPWGGSGGGGGGGGGGSDGGGSFLAGPLFAGPLLAFHRLFARLIVCVAASSLEGAVAARAEKHEGQGGGGRGAG
jgi:hypothetical protein